MTSYNKLVPSQSDQISKYIGGKYFILEDTGGHHDGGHRGHCPSGGHSTGGHRRTLAQRTLEDIGPEDSGGHWRTFAQRTAEDTGGHCHRGQRRTLEDITTEDSGGHYPRGQRRTLEDTPPGRHWMTHWRTLPRGTLGEHQRSLPPGRHWRTLLRRTAEDNGE